jgi:hypothetical protein
MAGATSVVADLVPSSSSLSARGLTVDAVLPTPGVGPDVTDRLALVLGAAGPGGLTGVSSEQALAVVEAVEAVKAWADSIALTRPRR